ncbi:DJ-1/PfpI family protein [Leptospira sp. 96542]|nr:DJ-1/PfpI family protein [Leptospira sp. 96542]
MRTKAKNAKMPKSILVPLFPGFEEMEAIIFIDVMRRGNQTVVSAANTKEPIIAARKTVHLADAQLSEINPHEFDSVYLPGGLLGTKNMMEDKTLQNLLETFHSSQKPIAAICAAPNVLREFGILQGDDPFTAFPNSTNLVQKTSGLYQNQRIVSHNNIHTSIGPGSAFEFSLYLLELFAGKEVKENVEEALHLP